jgi:flagellar hook assembly protein FlgD
MDIRNNANAATAISAENKAKLNKSPIASKAAQMFYKSMQAERKGRSQIEQGDDLEKISESIDNAMDFATKLMMASAKNMGFPDEDGGSNKSTEMMEMAKGISEMMIAKANVNAQMSQLKASKNPAIDLMGLKGKVIDYQDGTRSFSGQPVTYNYKVSHSEQSSSAVITNHFSIYDEHGVTVRNITQTGKSGIHTLEWDGKDNAGNEVMPGKEYTLAIRSEGKKDVGGNQVSFPVTASATLSGVVEGIKIEKGAAVGVIINGQTVNRDQIVNARDIAELENDIVLDTDLIGKKVELDLSRVQVKNGALDVYFNNHVEKPGHLTVEVSDSNGKYLTTLINEETIGVGCGKVRFPIELENGNYIVKVSVQDLQDPGNIQNITLEDKRYVIVGSIIPKDGVFVSTDEEAFSSHTIGAVIGNYSSPTEREEAAYHNATVTYTDDIFVYKHGVENTPTILFDKAEDDSIIEYAAQNIYDNETGALVAIAPGEYRAFELLNNASQVSDAIKLYVVREFGA